MSYQETLARIHTYNALETLELEPELKGQYIQFKCQCGKTAAIKRLGDKKNLWFCPSCKSGGNIISLTMKIKGFDEKDAVGYKKSTAQLLKLTPSDEILTEEVKTKYQLQFGEYLESQGFTPEFCEGHGIGIPKGKTMLAGCVAFEIHDDEGKVLAYYGIRIKTGKPVFYRTFNPELYLLNYPRLAGREMVVFVTDPLQAMRLLQDDVACVSNFGLPYLSMAQIGILNEFPTIEFRTAQKQIMADAVNNISAFYRFIR
jgi:hypothetical protein